MAEVTMVPLSSSNISAAGYDEDAGELIVEFSGGAEYAYTAPRSVYDALLAAPSAGRYLARSIKPVYPVRRVS